MWDRESVEVLEDSGDVITGTGMGEQSSRRVLDVLEFIKHIRKTVSLLEVPCNGNIPRLLTTELISLF